MPPSQLLPTKLQSDAARDRHDTSWVRPLQQEYKDQNEKMRSTEPSSDFVAYDLDIEIDNVGDAPVSPHDPGKHPRPLSCRRTTALLAVPSP